MKPRKKDESDASYIARLEARNKDMEQLGKWARKTSRAVTWLAVDASLAFQAMAEKAGVRSHPSVTAVVQAFDTIAHPQWTDDSATMPDLTFPTDWDLDPPDAWVGDADMELNAAIARTMEYLESRKFSGGLRKGEMDLLFELQSALEKPLQGILDKTMPARAAPPLPEEIPAEASRDDLARTIQEMSWRAFEIAEDMHINNALLRRDLRAASYRRMARDLCEIGRVRVRVEADERSASDAEAIPF